MLKILTEMRTNPSVIKFGQPRLNSSNEQRFFSTKLVNTPSGPFALAKRSGAVLGDEFQSFCLQVEQTTLKIQLDG